MRPEPAARTLAGLCLRRAQTHPDHLAVDDGEEALTYAELAARALAAAAMLTDRGVTPGGRVALQARNSTAWVVAAFGALLTGAALTPIGHGASHSERAAVLDGLEPAVLVHDDDLPPASGLPCVPLSRLAAPTTQGGPVAAVAEPEPGAEQPALVLSSSGTTGAVKSVPMRHEQLLRLYADVAEAMGVRSSDRVLVAVPLAHSFGFNGLLLVAMLAGASVRLLATYDRAAIAGVVRADALTVLAGPPTIYHDLERSGPLPSARLAIAGGQVVGVDELAQVARRLGVAELVIGYGMTETCGTVALARLPVPGPGAPALEGAPMSPLPGVEVAVRDEAGHDLTGQPGRVLVRGYNLATPYGESDGLLPGGWFDTGDLGVLDATGRLQVVGRSSDMLIVSGFNVHPRDVESVLTTHPEVAAVAVVGVPDRRRGQRLVAFVVPGQEGLDVGDLDAFARRRLSAYKVPGDYQVVDALPVTSTGKLARSRLRRLAAGEAAPQ